jgi:tRNA dimethylallyltransferase
VTHGDKYLVVIAGPTAVGKTDVAIEVARHFGAPVLSADSRQFYRGMDIGTAKPAPRQLELATHYFIDNKDPGALYGAGHFGRDAVDLLEKLYKSSGLAILCGGSGLYIHAVLEGIDEMPEIPAGLRASLTGEYTARGMEWLRAEIMRLDKTFAESADLNNPQRLLRALEVSIAAGKPYSSFRNQKASSPGFIPIRMLLNLPRAELYARIDARVDSMVKNGLIDEVKKLIGYRDSNALKTVGYREIIEYLDGKMSLENAIDRIKQHTRNYAKRQLTWFRNRGGYAELPPHSETVISHIRKMSGG